MSSQKDMEELRELLHNIKSPITSILGYSQLLKENLSKSSLSKEAKWAETLNKESLRVKDLIEEISQKVKDTK